MLVNTLANGLLDLLFINTAMTNFGDAGGLRATATAGSLYFSLHTAFPGQSGDQTSNEATFTNYARVAVPRSGSGFSRSGRVITNVAAIAFAAAGNAVAEVITHWGIGTASSGSGQLLFAGQIKRSTGSVLLGTAKTDDSVTIPGHTFSVGDKIGVLTCVGQTLPSGLTDGSVYFVKTVSGDNVTLSATSGGATLDITAAGIAWFVPAISISVVEPIKPQLDAGAVSIRF